MTELELEIKKKICVNATICANMKIIKKSHPFTKDQKKIYDYLVANMFDLILLLDHTERPPIEGDDICGLFNNNMSDEELNSEISNRLKFLIGVYDIGVKDFNMELARLMKIEESSKYNES